MAHKEDSVDITLALTLSNLISLVSHPCMSWAGKEWSQLLWDEVPQ